MRSRSRFVFSFLLLLFPAVFPLIASARTWNVTDAASLQAAQSSSADGDTISIAAQAQPYVGPVRLKNGQTLAGTGGKPRIDAGAEGAIILASANRIENASRKMPGINRHFLAPLSMLVLFQFNRSQPARTRLVP